MFMLIETQRCRVIHEGLYNTLTNLKRLNRPSRQHLKWNTFSAVMSANDIKICDAMVVKKKQQAAVGHFFTTKEQIFEIYNHLMNSIFQSK